MLMVIDEHSRECLATRTENRQNQETVLETLSDLFLLHGPPQHLRSDNGVEFTATAVREWLQRLEIQTLFIDPGSPWENGYNEASTANYAMSCSTVKSSLRYGKHKYS